MEADLQRDGWSLSEKGLEHCKAICANKKPSKKDIITNALHMDIREIGRQILPADINKNHVSEIHGPMVLQILKVKNVSAPNAKEDSSLAPRMLKLTMTDGVITCYGIEMEAINAISLSTPPGSKVCLLGTIAVQHGFVLLESRNLKFLGGEVEHLRAKWELSKNVSKMQRKVLTAEGGPPLFVPFEDSDFARRKPQGPSVTIKHVEANFKPKGKPAQKIEKPSIPYEEKKIWKSEPFNGKKGNAPSSVKSGPDVQEKNEARQKTQTNTEANGKQSSYPSRIGDERRNDGREQNKGAFVRKDNKDTGPRGGKKQVDKGKEWNNGEENRHGIGSNRDARNSKSEGFVPGGKDNKDTGPRGGKKEMEKGKERSYGEEKRRGVGSSRDSSDLKSEGFVTGGKDNINTGPRGSKKNVEKGKERNYAEEKRHDAGSSKDSKNVKAEGFVPGGKDNKDTGARGGKKEAEKGKERNYGEENKYGVRSSKDSRNLKSEGFFPGGKDDKVAGKAGRPQGKDGYDSRGQSQHETISHDRSEKFNKRLGKHDSGLPPRLEKLKQNTDQNVKRDFKEENYTRDVSTKTKDPKAVSTVDDDMKQVTDLINQRMKLDDRNIEGRGTHRNQPPPGSTFKDRNFKKPDYRKPGLNPTQAASGSNREGKSIDERNDRFSSETTRNQYTEDGRGYGRPERGGKRERGYGGNRRGYDGHDRVNDRHDRVNDRHDRINDSHDGSYNAREHGRRADYDRGSKWEDRPKNGQQRYSNDPINNQWNHVEVSSEIEVNRRHDKRGFGANAEVMNNQMIQSNPNNGVNATLEADLAVTQDKEKSDKVGVVVLPSPRLSHENDVVKDFINAVVINSAIPNNLMGGDRRHMQHPVSSDQNQTQTNMQAVVNSYVMNNYYPPYAVYQPPVQQAYQNVPNQDFQQSGYQPPIHPMQPLNQYRQYTVSTTVQDFRYVQSVSPQTMNFEKHGMPRAGQQGRQRTYVRHDVYRPKQN